MSAVVKSLTTHVYTWIVLRVKFGLTSYEELFPALFMNIVLLLQYNVVPYNALVLSLRGHMLIWIFPFNYLINCPCLVWFCFEGQSFTNQINNNHDSRSREVLSVNCNSRFLLTFICGKSLLWSISAAKGTSSFSQSFRTLVRNYNTL